MTDSLERRLHIHAAPPDHLARRVQHTLRRRGLLRGRPPVARVAALLLVAAGCSGLGVLAARWEAPPSQAQAEVDRYVLLLYADDSFAPPVTGQALVAEYGDWARQLRAEGRLEFAERLEPTEQFVGSPFTSTGNRLTGMFIIQAPSREAAEATARTSPHARYGGTVVIRRILPS